MPGEPVLEAARNALLRRVDWRFLLPSAPSPTAVCDLPGPLADALELLVPTVWSVQDLPADGRCGIAVVTAPTSRSLRRAWNALEAGGICYVEWRRFPWQGVAALRQRLGRAGFADVACFAVPSSEETGTPAGWFSLDADGAVDHLLASAPRPHGRLRRSAARILERLAPDSRYGSVVAAMARKPTGTAPAVPGDDAGSELTSRTWTASGVGDARCRPVWTLLTGGRRSINKVVALAFTGAEATPRLAVKLARVPEAREGLLNEVRSLRALEAVSPLVKGIPRVVFCGEVGGALAVGETPVVGRRFAHAIRLGAGADVASRAAEWLDSLVVERGPCALDERRQRIIGPAVADFVRAYGGVADRVMLRDAIAAIDALGPLPLAHEQRDFAPWNLLITPAGGLGVLDWESAELDGLPLLDLIYFVTYFAFYSAGARTLDAYRRVHRDTLNQATAIGRLSGSLVAEYTARTKLDPAAVWALRLLTWMLHARSEYRQFVADAAGRPGVAALRQSVFLALWEEELRTGGGS